MGEKEKERKLNIDMEALLRRYPPPDEKQRSRVIPSAACGQLQTKQRVQSASPADVAMTSCSQTAPGGSNFDMAAALKMYPPGLQGRSAGIKYTECPGRQKQRRVKPSNSQLRQIEAPFGASERENYAHILRHYSPSAEDLKAKGMVTEHAVCAGRSKGHRRRQELRRRNIDDVIDLHGLYRQEAQKRLESFLRDARTRGLRKVCIVHGKGHHSAKGRGVLQRLVCDFLHEYKAAGKVLEFHHPPERDGGNGATIAVLGRNVK